ncbi:MAG TPA: MBL fold metallo-hydrolase [Streptosporangiaceae bacterium]|jgi:glyoxylase-like metal-dependent hydrolase (beta-lactamase superfamily II)|nr:MBL fold metallo-hydrolase [Streptosporangiaceae bacterium]
MTYTLETPVLGVPASSPEHGSLGWSSPALLLSERHTVVVDPGGPGYQQHWDSWLAAAGRTRSDVDTVLVTHAHWDHLAAAAWFPGAELGIGRLELEWARRCAGTDPYLHPALVQMVETWPALRPLVGGERVHGIDSVATPGHTPGHLSYHVPTPGAPVLVVGDAVKNAYELATGDLQIASDRAAAVTSLGRVRGLAARGARILLGHDGVYEVHAGVLVAIRRARLSITEVPG